ncbi:unnamed protein product [Eruca vesicaria subsp. sativa]|uniref:t-SNARE coiled-coil homology domain-containing protein n=1 Tax=Eruca vesicaria subsp. sativa TaxID=29727 RepID=A0ABC8LTD3_ERUVS|nr:unnamed protein product [Eruca vesicaria subsp. sativa]
MQFLTHKTRLHIGKLVKDTSARLKEVSETDHQRGVDQKKKILDAKLAKEFQSVLKEFQKAQRLAAERETFYAPPLVTKPSPPSSNTASEIDVNADKHQEQRSLLEESKRQELALLDNEAVIEEREQAIEVIQRQISELHEIFKDLAQLVHDQRPMIADDICTNIDNSHAATAQGNSHLAEASKTQRSNSSLTCLLLVVFGIVLMIVIIVLAV